MKKAKCYIVAILSIMFFLVCSCADMQQVPEGPPSYRDGFRDGSNSGYVSAGHPYYKWTKDFNRYDSDSLYKQGWNDGFRKCKGSYESIQRTLKH